MTDEFDREKGMVFREKREELGESLLEAAKRLAISPAWLSRLERGLERWPEGENSLSVDPCTATEKAPHNLMDFRAINQTLWMMAGGIAIGRAPPDAAYPWWCKDCGWPLTPMGMHFEIEIGEGDE